MTEDRLIILGEEHFEEFYRDQLKDVGLDYLKAATGAGFTPILISDSVDAIVQPLAKHLGIAHVVCNHLEIRNGKATGKCLMPLSTGRISGQQLRGLAAENGWDLGQCRGYGSQETDITLLSALGNPCTITPDRSLRAIAKDLQWPIVER